MWLDGITDRKRRPDIGTYRTVMGKNNTEDQGVITTKDGQEMATWTGQKIGRFRPRKNNLPWVLHLRTCQTSEGKLSFLSNRFGVFWKWSGSLNLIILFFSIVCSAAAYYSSSDILLLSRSRLPVSSSHVSCERASNIPHAESLPWKIQVNLEGRPSMIKG